MQSKTLVISAAVLALAISAAAQTKISGTAKCDNPTATHVLSVPDRPNHSFTIGQGNCKWTKPFEIAGLQATDGVSTASAEITGNKSNGRGVFVGNMAGGDKFNVRFQEVSTLKDGAPQTVEGKWTFAGGTGKLKGITGQGTHKAKAAPDGVIVEVEGEYTLPK